MDGHRVCVTLYLCHEDPTAKYHDNAGGDYRPVGTDSSGASRYKCVASPGGDLKRAHGGRGRLPGRNGASPGAKVLLENQRPIFVPRGSPCPPRSWLTRPPSRVLDDAHFSS